MTKAFGHLLSKHFPDWRIVKLLSSKIIRVSWNSSDSEILVIKLA